MMLGSQRGKLAAVSVFVAVASSGLADMMMVVPRDGYGSGPGGEFNLTPKNFGFVPLSVGGAGTFESFCLEYNEHISYGTNYYAVIATEARSGGVGGGNPDPLDRLTAYLYESFIRGLLNHFDYDISEGTADRVASANALQDVIWFIEQERPRTWTPGDNSLRDRFYRDAQENAPLGIGNVRVLNLYRNAAHTQFAQDQLVLIPEPATIGALLLGGLAMMLRR